MTASRKMTRRILHTSDIHLESFGDKACTSLEAVVRVAQETEVDLVLIVGDLFEHNRVDDKLVSFTIEQFKKLPMTVAILPGNHDCLIPETVYNRTELWQAADNVRVLNSPHGESLEFPELGLTLWGKSVDSYASGVLPMEGIPSPKDNGQWHIAMAHGYYVDGNTGYLPSLGITHEEIAGSGWDYVALGHWPVFRCVCDESVKAYYCDSPSLQRTVNIVDFDRESGVQITRHSLQQE